MSKVQQKDNVPILTITGSDGTGGSGVQADIKTVSALGGYAVTAITSITVQNTLGIQEFYDLPADTVTGQVEAIVNDVQPKVVKIGMIRRSDVMVAVAKAIERYKPDVVIYDPVVVSSKGDVLMSLDLLGAMRQWLLPLCTLVVLKKSDAEHILGRKIGSSSAGDLLKFGCGNVLMHCGNIMASSNTDVLITGDGDDPTFITNLCSEIPGLDNHGMSGNLSAAIAVFCAKGQPLDEAVRNASVWMANLFAENRPLTGRGNELFNEFVNEITEHFASHNDVRFYADRLNVSSTYLAQVTKRIAGKAPKVIIDEYVASEAQSMLVSSTKTVQEIAYALGFSSQAHFTKFFRKAVGCTPSEYRRRK